MSGIRLRYLVDTSPRPEHRPTAETPVTFAPMEALRGGVGGLDTSRAKPFAQVASGSYNFFENGDVLLAKVTPCFENGKKGLAQGLLNGMGFATSEVHVLRPKPGRIEGRFLLYLLSSNDLINDGIASMTGSGGLRRVNERAILDHQILITDMDDQKKIADFLDRETARIDKLIESKNRLLHVLNAKRSVTISNALLGPDADLSEASKSSLPKLRYFLRPIPTSSTIKNTVPMEFSPGLYPGYSASGQDVWVERPDYNGDAIVLSAVGARCGKTFLATGEWGSVANTVGLAVTDKACTRFFWYLTNQENFWVRGGAAQPYVQVAETLRIRMHIPSLEDQKEIAKSLDRDVARIDAVKEKTSESITYLREYRSSLITAAVTGQIDVTSFKPDSVRDGQAGQDLERAIA